MHAAEQNPDKRCRMLTKIISIKNVGRFRHSAGQTVPQLSRHVLVLGANGYGKTTLCAVLRSLQTGEPDHVNGRRTLGSDSGCEIHLLTSADNVRFGPSGWTRAMPEIYIFDSTFVAENVHAGDVVELEQKRNLYRVIIGQDGVGLATEDARLATESRTKATEMAAASKGLQTHLPPEMKLEEFLKLATDPQIDGKIAEQARTVEAVRQIEQLRARAALTAFALPVLPDGLAAMLAWTMEDIADDAELQVSAHLAAHQMTNHGEAWLAEGVPFIADDKCPFCGQDVKGVSLIASYRSMFSKAYATLKGDLLAFRTSVATSFGDKVVGELMTQDATNATAMEFWKRYCTIEPGNVDAPDDIATILAGLISSVLALLDRKAQSPLETIDLATDAGFLKCRAAFDQLVVRIQDLNGAINAVNAIIAAKKAATAGNDGAAAETVMNRLLATKKRHEPAVAEACTAYSELEGKKAELDRLKTTARAKLDAHTKTVVKPYENRINVLLDDFNAGFRIAGTKHAYPGGQATSSYQLVINDTPIDTGDGKSALSKPSFKNTLSAGDRTTLALAFFIAGLEHDPSRASRIVVFDDPFNSQDAFRRQQTVYCIKKAGELCAQVFVLSHDAGFLRQVWEKCPVDQRVAIQLTDHRTLGSKIGLCDLDEVCKGRVANEVDDLLQFFNTGAGKAHDVAKKMRVVLESYCRSAFPGVFEPTDMLGAIVKKIRDEGHQHPAHTLLDDLDQINDYSRDHHHGVDPTDGVTNQTDDTEMRGFVKKTLRISNNLQA